MHPSPELSRRRFLAATATETSAALAGCNIEESTPGTPSTSDSIPTSTLVITGDSTHTVTTTATATVSVTATSSTFSTTRSPTPTEETPAATKSPSENNGGNPGGSGGGGENTVIETPTTTPTETSAVVIESGETHRAGSDGSYDAVEWEDGGVLVLENNAVLELTEITA
ncbi:MULTISPECIES: hypothetical protein [Halolamina]|uniref:hypothetical protein n=1 Tax=Halolamina TaxID=1075397 RepID=UPI0011603699|nr:MULTISPECIES: hypothetical protein [Halolamina]NHX36759.1 hypothetical protein [Halolamina sp. R1-12]